MHCDVTTKWKNSLFFSVLLIVHETWEGPMTTRLMLQDKSQRQTDRNRQKVSTYVNRFILLQRLSNPPTVPSPSCFKRFCWVFREETADVLMSFLPVSAQPFGTLCRNYSWDLTQNFPHVAEWGQRKTAWRESSDNTNSAACTWNRTGNVFFRGFHQRTPPSVLVIFFFLSEVEVINWALLL